MTVRLAAGVSTSPTVNASAPVAVSSAVVWSATSLIVGGSFTAVTVSDERVASPSSVPSLTVTVIVAVPLWFAAGVTVTVRLAPLPPKTMFASGTSVWFDEVAVTVRLRRRRLDVAHREGEGAGRRVLGAVWSAMSLIVGGSFDGGDRQHEGVGGRVAVPSLTVTRDGRRAALIGGRRDGHRAVRRRCRRRRCWRSGPASGSTRSP